MPTKAPEVIRVKANVKEVECCGDGGAMGHPRVFYTFDGSNRITCEYCDREFLKPKK